MIDMVFIQLYLAPITHTLLSMILRLDILSGVGTLRVPYPGTSSIMMYSFQVWVFLPPLLSVFGISLTALLLIYLFAKRTLPAEKANIICSFSPRWIRTDIWFYLPVLFADKGRRKKRVILLFRYSLMGTSIVLVLILSFLFRMCLIMCSASLLCTYSTWWVERPFLLMIREEVFSSKRFPLIAARAAFLRYNVSHARNLPFLRHALGCFQHRGSIILSNYTIVQP